MNSRTQLKLSKYKQPINNVFHPSEPYLEQRLLPQASTSGGATPLPDFSSSTPAWDPSSRSPIPDLSGFLSPSQTPFSPLASSVASTSRVSDSRQPEAQPHFFLNSRLLGATLKVVVNGGEYKDKELDAYLAEANGQLSIRHDHYKSSIPLQPDWVTPKHPCPKREKGLLIVIKGEHYGKYVRRIQHRNENEQAIMILAVIRRETGVADVLSEERLELCSEFLCAVFETKEEKKASHALLASLRHK